MYFKNFKGTEISALGFGALHLPTVENDYNRIDREKSFPVIDKAIECKINYFDTAYTYQNGDSERFLGEALAKYPRESYLLATKYYARQGGDIAEVFEEQLKRLKTDYIDFYMLHSLDEEYFSDYTDRKKDYIGFMLKQKQMGRIRHIGFSTHASAKVLTNFLDYFEDFDMTLMQLNYVDWENLKAKEQYEILTKRNIPVWVMEPLKAGRLVSLNDKARGILKEANPNRSIASWGMRYLMGLDNVHTVLSGMSTVEQVEDNAKTFERAEPLSESELKILSKAAKAYTSETHIACSACRYCIPYCSARLDIPLLISAYNEYKLSGSAWKIEGFEKAKGPENCTECGMCLKHCPQHINAALIMKQLAELNLQ